MGSGGRGAPRVLAVYGSESGNSKSAIKKIIKRWQEQGLASEFTVLSGNEVASLDALPEKHDIIVISTSSFGEGDPPENYSRFLLKLLQASTAKETPLAGMPHAVIGFGASVYETFQNVPRLTDKACRSS